MSIFVVFGVNNQNTVYQPTLQAVEVINGVRVVGAHCPHCGNDADTNHFCANHVRVPDLAKSNLEK